MHTRGILHNADFARRRPAAPALLCRLLRADALYRQRAALAELDDRMLRDIGHTNPPLVEANVPCHTVLEMDEINDDFPSTDIAIVVYKENLDQLCSA